MTEGTVAFEPAGVSTKLLATLGEGHIAYVKQIRSEERCRSCFRRRRKSRLA